MSEPAFTVIGLSDSRAQFFPPEIRTIIARGRVFSGGKRHHEIVQDLLPEGSRWIDVTVPLEEAFRQYAEYPEIVVFASGDPLFYGYATTLMREFPKAHIQIYPFFNSLQMLAHKRCLPYHDMVYVSLTGRPWKNLDKALIRGERMIGVLTDRNKTPNVIAQRMLQYGYDNYQMTVGENLGHETRERIRQLSLQEATEQTFDCPNCLILTATSLRHPVFGIPETAFFHLEGREKMITKMPIRLLTLSMLDLGHHPSFWDIGFCTGSVSIEARLQFPECDITAFEIRPESERLLQLNSEKFGAPSIQYVIGDFLHLDLSPYPRPEAVFIGGHGGKLIEMLQRIDSVLLPGGVIVFNSVSDETCRTFVAGIETLGRKIIETHRIALDAYNPITVLKAQ